MQSLDFLNKDLLIEDAKPEDDFLKKHKGFNRVIKNPDDDDP